MLVINSIKPKDFDKYLFHNTTLVMKFLTRIISNARIILLPTVHLGFKIFYYVGSRKTFKVACSINKLNKCN